MNRYDGAMPGEYIENPRRAPRAAVRCEARVALRDGGFFAVGTTECGPGGCQVTTPAPLEPGARVFLELDHASTPVPFRLSGRVAWAKADPTPRAGIAFDAPSAALAARLYSQVTVAEPPPVELPRGPDRISVDDLVVPAFPPDPAPQLTSEEALVLAAAGGGLTVGALRAKLAARWTTALHATFSLVGRGLLRVGAAPDPAAAAAWSARLAPPPSAR